MQIKLTYSLGNEIQTVVGTPDGEHGPYFVIRKAEGGILSISKRLILKVEDVK